MEIHTTDIHFRINPEAVGSTAGNLLFLKLKLIKSLFRKIWYMKYAGYMQI